ncbi:hypothetical protein, partial [Duganella lactea]|uniref:hypothetical protein n=1 Tax=Duganella lactea TaxID=2692173 RepID=UPI001E45F616
LKISNTKRESNFQLCYSTNQSERTYCFFKGPLFARPAALGRKLPIAPGTERVVLIYNKIKRRFCKRIAGRSAMPNGGGFDANTHRKTMGNLEKPLRLWHDVDAPILT